jgi:hypothetical protein
MLLLTSCAGLLANKQPSIAVSQIVIVPDDCERVLNEQPVVQVEKGKDWRALFYRAQDGQIVENKVIRSGRECIANERKLYGAVK